VYKRGSEYTKLQYLAHYADISAICEARVRKIVQEELNCVRRVAVPNEQSLLQFLLKFEQIVVERCPQNLQKLVHALLDRMRARPTFRAMLYEHRAVFIRSAADLKLIELITTAMKKQPDEVVAIQTTLRFLASGANTFRLLLFAVSFDAIVRRLSVVFPDKFCVAGIDDPAVAARGQLLIRALVEMNETEMEFWLLSMISCGVGALLSCNY
jgi:hypothetical protein